MTFGTRWPPVPAGILIGISMLLAFVVAGRGIGASGAMTRLVAWVQHGLFPAATEISGRVWCIRRTTRRNSLEPRAARLVNPTDLLLGTYRC